MTDIDTSLIEAARSNSIYLRPVVLLDWHDGPIAGIVEVREPLSYWYFQLFAERRRQDDLDDRLFTLAHLPAPAMKAIREAGGEMEDRPLVWPFDQTAAPERVSAAVDAAISAARTASLLVRTADFRVVIDVWRVAPTATKAS
jgi:hypothetical protein